MTWIYCIWAFCMYSIYSAVGDESSYFDIDKSEIFVNDWQTNATHCQLIEHSTAKRTCSACYGGERGDSWPGGSEKVSKGIFYASPCRPPGLCWISSDLRQCFCKSEESQGCVRPGKRGQDLAKHYCHCDPPLPPLKLPPDWPTPPPNCPLPIPLGCLGATVAHVGTWHWWPWSSQQCHGFHATGAGLTAVDHEIHSISPVWDWVSKAPKL